MPCTWSHHKATMCCPTPHSHPIIKPCRYSPNHARLLCNLPSLFPIETRCVNLLLCLRHACSLHRQSLEVCSSINVSGRGSHFNVCPPIVNWCIQSQKNPQSCDPAIYVHIIMTCTHACAFVCCFDTASLRDPLNKYKSRAPLVRQYILIDWFTHGEECMFLRLYIFALSYNKH